MAVPRPTPDTPGKAPAAVALPVGLLVGLFLAALNLRPALASVSPLLNTIRADVHMTRPVAGLLTTIPTLCIGIGAFLAPRLGARAGHERALMAAIVLIGVATLARLGASSAAVLFATTLLVGAGIAVAQTLLPPLVSTHFPRHPMLATAVYSLGITLGTAIPAAVAAPLRYRAAGVSLPVLAPVEGAARADDRDPVLRPRGWCATVYAGLIT